MSGGDALEFEIQSDPTRLSEVRERVREWVLSRGWEQNTAADIVLAVDEALTNVIRHGYDSRTDERICLELREIQDPQRGPGIDVTIRDFGRQVSPENIVGRDLDEIRPGGLGVHIIRNVMDAAEYACAEGGGMRLHMQKFREPPAAAEGSQEEPAPDE